MVMAQVWLGFVSLTHKIRSSILDKKSMKTTKFYWSRILTLEEISCFRVIEITFKRKVEW